MSWNLEFENAHCHTYYSNPLTLPDSTISIEDYAKTYRDRNMHCLVCSEHGYRGNVWAQADIAKKYSKGDYQMKAICAAETYFVPDRNPDLKDGRNFHLLLIAKDNEGFRQLNKILSESQVSGYYRAGRVDFELLSQLDYRHFIATTACVGGVLKDEHGERLACQLAEIFRENFRLEIQYHNNDVQIAHNLKVLNLYKKYKWPLFFATDSHYIDPEDKLLRKELQLSSKIEMDDGDWLLYLPTAEDAYKQLEAQKIFSKAQIEESFENTLQLREFEGFSYTSERKFPISRPELTIEQRNRLYKQMVCNGYIEKAGMPSKEEAAELHSEMDTIVDTNSADYFIGLHDMLKRGQELGGILTTTSRGSACGFASNFALGFTSINRLRCPVKMYPDRFISKAKLESGSMPDIDSNITNVEAFEQAGREIFGEHGCYPMVAYGTTKTLSAFKLLARARDIDFDVSNEVSKQIKKYENDCKHAIENNQDDPDYNVDDDIDIADYVDEEYLPLIEDSKQYKNIVVTQSPHPCAHLIYHKDIREEIGIVRLKAKTGGKEAQFCAYIDGNTADKVGYVKSDLLRVDVVKIINEGFKAVGQSVMTADELVEATKDDPEVWKLFEDGYTIGLNQTEKLKTTEKVKRFKPKNTVELAAFIAAIRPGAKSLVDTFVARQHHEYSIPAMDALLKLNGATGETGNSSFLFYDEQVMTLAKAAGISPADANALIKHIKKKHLDDVAAYKERFIPGFISYLKNEQGTSDELAESTAQDVWKVILDSSSYLFNASHAYAMCLDCLYNAYLKRHYPFEYYATLLKLYTDKGKKEKVALIIAEMKQNKGIVMRTGRFGEDNRDWYIDKENSSISQSLSSIKFISKQAAQELYEAGQMEFETFTDVLRHLQMNTSVNVRQIGVLIGVRYFEEFGGNAKLYQILEEFHNGKNKLTKTVKSYEKRLMANRIFECSLEESSVPIREQLAFENEMLGLCLTTCSDVPTNLFFVLEVDTQYGIKAMLYNIKRGTSGVVRLKKATFSESEFKPGQCIYIKQGKSEQRCMYKGSKRIPIEGEFDYWVKQYKISQD